MKPEPPVYLHSHWMKHKGHDTGGGGGWRTYNDWGGSKSHKRVYTGTDWTLQDFLFAARQVVGGDVSFFEKIPDPKDAKIVMGLWKNFCMVNPETGIIMKKFFKFKNRNCFLEVERFDVNYFTDGRLIYGFENLAYWDTYGNYHSKMNTNNQWIGKTKKKYNFMFKNFNKILNRTIFGWFSKDKLSTKSNLIKKTTTKDLSIKKLA